MIGAGARVRALTRDGGTARLVLWLWILLWTVDLAMEAVGSGEQWAACVVCAVMLSWDLVRRRLGRWTALPGIILVIAAIALTSSDLVLSGRVAAAWGVTIIAVSLRWRVAVPLSLVALGVTTWIAVESAPSTLPVYVLGLLSHLLLPFLLLRISITARRLRDTQEALARTEVDAERDRLAEELNTLIGQTLNQVALQVAEARSAAGDRHPDLQAHLGDVDVLVHRGLDQLRLLSHEPVIDDLDTEVDTAQTLCHRLGVSFTAAADTVDAAADGTFALLLRESVTNMFKHAIPTRCTLVARTEQGEAVFSFTNDGADENARPTRKGTGQGRWRTAVTKLGGTLDTGPLVGGRYRVLARIPVADPTRPTAASGSLERNTHA